MSFVDSAAELLDRTESSLNSLIADALKAKAYREITTLAAMAEAVAAIGSGRARDGRKMVDVGASIAAPVPEPPKASEPSWMRPKG